MIASIAAQIVAKFIEKRWPSDKEDIYEILRLGINKAWQEGKWLGMTAEMFVNVYKETSGQSYIISPQSHPVLLALNGTHAGGIPIRDEYFMFHRNGYGDIRDYPGCNWNQDVYSIGEVPYVNKNNINFSEGVRIGVRSLGIAGPNEKLYINGTYKDGERIFTYKKKDYGNCCGCNTNTDEIDTVNGIEIPITNDFNYINNICFSSILSITKTQTRTPIEVIAIDSSNSAYVIARMLPAQRFSKYKKYLVPNNLCGRTTMHGLFKIAKQEYIKDDTDNIIIENDEALISLAMGAYNMYHKQQMELGAQYFLSGITVLDKEKKEESSPVESPIQVSGTYDGDLDTALKYNS
jgi:hypothetical protein